MTDKTHEREYKVGYGKPPKHTQFGQPGGNKPGLTSEAALALHEATERSARLYLQMVTDLEAKIEDMKKDGDSKDDFAAVNAIKSDVLRMMKDIMDRTIGQPTAKQDHTSSDGSMTPQAHGDAVLEAIKVKHKKTD